MKRIIKKFLVPALALVGLVVVVVKGYPMLADKLSAMRSGK